MYGYVLPKKEFLKQQDFVLYRAFYCGICKATGRMYGQLPRFTTNFDIVFLSLLLHDCAGMDVEFASGGCVLNPIKKKVTVKSNALLDDIVAANILLSYHKVRDDIVDRERGGKRLIARLLKKHYNRARDRLPHIDNVIIKHYVNLTELERANETSIDRSAHCFSQMLAEIAELLLQGRMSAITANNVEVAATSEAEEKISDVMLAQEERADKIPTAEERLGYIKQLCYNVGKFVYLVDAIDDLEEDFRKNRYNPFLASYGNYKSRTQFISDNFDQMSFILAITVNRAIESFNSLPFHQSYDLLRNIIYKGMRDKCEQILKSSKKLPKPKI